MPTLGGGIVMDLAGELIEIANADVISDVAADATRAAASTARVNIDINAMAPRAGLNLAVEG